MTKIKTVSHGTFYGAVSESAKRDPVNSGTLGSSKTARFLPAQSIGPKPVMRTDACRVCGDRVEFDTDGDGNLVAYEAELHRRHRRHPCEGA